VPTFSEAGLPSFAQNAWYGLFAPAGIPKPIVDKLTAELKKMLQLPALREQLERQGVEPSYSTPEQFSAMMNAETIRLKAVIKAANIKLN
jgi:tripartite-type tricarboxylate transporter receptor subunit TctC